jgi:biopolymer transport protein ExbD
MRRRPAFAIPASQPISEINITPLIDVMLVLLIMFIITIPMATHSVKIDLPREGEPLTPPRVFTLALDSAGRVSWDGAPLAESALPARLAAVKADRDAVLQVRTDGEARYEDFDRVLAMVKGAGIVRLGFVDNQRYADSIR